MAEPHGAFGWAKADLVNLDASAPGLISHILTTSPRRRQAIFALLAEREMARTAGQRAVDPNGDTQLATSMRLQRAREMLVTGLGPVTEGYVAALENLDVGPLPPARTYTRLREVFTDPAQRHDAALLRTGPINDRTLTVLDALDSRWRLRGVLARVSTAMAGREVNKAMTVVQSVCSTATDEALRRSIDSLPPERSLADLVMRYTRRADRFPPNPVQADRDLRPLASARDFMTIGLQFRNCLRDRIEDALAGRAAYAVYRDVAVMEFRPLANGYGWLLYEVHAPRNDFVEPDLRAAVRAKSLDVGIPYVDDGVGRVDFGRSYRALRSPAAPS